MKAREKRSGVPAGLAGKVWNKPEPSGVPSAVRVTVYE
jgi:hypothetical protein